jgi:hypothetical protein
VCETDPTIAPFEEWVQELLQAEPLDVTDPDDFDKLLLCTPPSQRALRYCRMKAFGNHFRVEDEASSRMLSYDSGVASVFEVPTADARDVSVHYVGVVKDILKVDYGQLSSPVLLLRCQWAKRTDIRRNPTYTRDDSGFLVVNVRPFHISWPSNPGILLGCSEQTRVESCITKRSASTTTSGRQCRRFHHNIGSPYRSNCSRAGATSTPYRLPSWCNRTICRGSIARSGSVLGYMESEALAPGTFQICM